MAAVSKLTLATVVTTMVRTPESERPQFETLDGVARWLRGAARREVSFAKVIDEYSWRLTAAGISLLRVGVNTSTLHPQFIGATYHWWKDEAETRKIMIKHEVLDIVPTSDNPVVQARNEGRTIRRRLEGDGADFDLSILADLKARGGTDYLVFPVESPFGFEAHVMTYVSDAPGGFRQAEIDVMTGFSHEIALIADMRSQRQIAENVLAAYLGAQTGPRVLAGKIQRGSGEEISAAIWSSDLRGFTALSDHAPSGHVIATLNELFDLQAQAIATHGGEILKFVGDGLLAIFPAERPEQARAAAQSALAAARETLAALALRPTLPGEAPLRLVIALHFGEVTYGNIGSVDRVDFTVIGPAVNLVSRIESVAKARDLPLIVSDDFACAYGYCSELPSLGAFELRGLDKPHNLFAPAVEGQEPAK
ncbi:MAG: adenylate/guanylate cyclase domain-containing protein [Pseudomonadota bacterium]|nr:adenylate/guanylate cyclase domain-containing protein [Pseudomonadota bacterium]